MTSFVTRRAIPSGNETAETATRRPAAGSLSQLWTYAGASAWFEPQGLFAVSLLGHPARAYAVLAAFGCIILPGRLAPEKLILDAPPLIQLSQNLAANSAQPDLVPANVNTVDGAGQMGPPSLDIDSVEVRTTQDLWRAEEPVDRQAEHLHRTLDATRTTAQVATPQVSEPAPGGVSAGVTESPPSGASADVTESKEKLFLEFEQWRAARIAGIAGSAAASPKARSKEKRHDRTTPRSGTEPVASSSGSIHAKGSASTDRGQLPRWEQGDLNLSTELCPRQGSVRRTSTWTPHRKPAAFGNSIFGRQVEMINLSVVVMTRRWSWSELTKKAAWHSGLSHRELRLKIWAWSALSRSIERRRPIDLTLLFGRVPVLPKLQFENDDVLSQGALDGSRVLHRRERRPMSL
jgi:hypothetical protein